MQTSVSKELGELTRPFDIDKAWVALETKLRQVCFDNQEIRQIPVIS